MTTTGWDIAVPVCISIIGGAITMAWRLGGIERAVKDLTARLTALERKFDRSRSPH